MKVHNLLAWVAIIFILLGTVIVSAQGTKGHPDRTLPWVTEEVKAPRVVYQTFESRAVGTRVSYHAYTPEMYDKSPDRLPVLYWLHGTDGGVAGVRPLAKFFDDAIRSGKVPPMIMVFVNGLPRRLWSDSKNGAAPIETVFITEVIPDVDKRFRTIPLREGRILEGFSMGGFGAARLGFKYPELFAGISILAGGPFDLELQGPRTQQNPKLREQLLREVCDGDLDYFKAISPLSLAETAAGRLRKLNTVIRQSVGNQDDIAALNRKFHNRLTALKIPHEFIQLEKVGHNTLGLLDALGEANGKYYRRVLATAREGAGR